MFGYHLYTLCPHTDPVFHAHALIFALMYVFYLIAWQSDFVHAIFLPCTKNTLIVHNHFLLHVCAKFSLLGHLLTVQNRWRHKKTPTHVTIQSYLQIDNWNRWGSIYSSYHNRNSCMIFSCWKINAIPGIEMRCSKISVIWLSLVTSQKVR